MTAEVSQQQRSNARDNRARILAVARAAFAAEGLEVPIREIARRARWRGHCLSVLPTKEALLGEVLAEPMARARRSSNKDWRRPTRGAGSARRSRS